MWSREDPFNGDAETPKSEFRKKVEAFFDDPLINEPKKVIDTVVNLVRLRRDGRRLVGLCESITGEIADARDSVIVPLAESNEDLEDLMDLRNQEVTGEDFKQIFGHGSVDS